jgi:uncharacterized protein (DUF4415 family)
MPKLKIGTIMPTPEENALINAGLALDADTYELSDKEFKQLKPMRGRPVGSKAARTKVAVSVRMDEEVLTYFKAQGRGWQTRMNEALKTLIAEHKL